MGHSLVVVGNKRENLLLEISKRAKVPTLEQFARQNAEPDLDLVHPGGVLRGIVEDDLMRRIMQKGRTRGHRLQDTALAFSSQSFLRNTFHFANPPPHSPRLYRIEL